MNYSTDRPINKSEEDLLGRAFFSKNLVEEIYKYNVSDGLVIGLFGKWGAGKTSIINMAREEIEKRPKNNENKPIIMDFSPWNYSDKNDLITLFFQSLKRKLGLEGNEKLKKDVGEALSNYVDVLDALSFVPLVGPGLATWLKAVAKGKGNNLMKTPDLNTEKENLEKKLRDSKQKIIIVIDDIDRLTNPQIRDIFQLVKQVANFPNIIYILSMDRDVVSRALEEVHKIDGNQYLEKIIQLPFEIPESNKSKINSIFISKWEKITKGNSFDPSWHKSNVKIILTYCIEPYINTLRDVNRVINTFDFRYGMLYEEILYEDMMAITTIEVLEPKLYKWIYNNKYLLCRGLNNQLRISGDSHYHRKERTDEFTRMNIDPEKAIRCISVLFPKFAEYVGENVIPLYNYFDTIENKRVAKEDKFDLYFAPDLDDINLSERTINQFIYKDDLNDLKDTINKQNKQGNIKFFINDIRSKIDEIPYERIGIIASALLCIEREINDDIDIYANQSSFSIYEMIIDCAYDIIKNFETSDERFNFIKKMIEDMSKFGLGWIACIINKIESPYGSSEGKSKNKGEKIITIEELKVLKQLYLKQIRDKAYSDSIFEVPLFKYAFNLWESIDKDEVEKYISNIYSDDLKILKFICSLADTVDGAETKSWTFPFEDYAKYDICIDYIEELIDGFDMKDIDKFYELEQIKFAILKDYIDRDTGGGINEEQAAKLVEEWKQSK